MKLDLGVGLGLCDIVLDGDPASPKKKGAQTPVFGSCLLWPNGRMDQDARPLCVCWGHSPPLKGGGHSPRIGGPCLLWPNGRPSQLLLSTCFVIRRLCKAVVKLVSRRDAPAAMTLNL